MERTYPVVQVGNITTICHSDGVTGSLLSVIEAITEKECYAIRERTRKGEPPYFSPKYGQIFYDNCFYGTLDFDNDPKTLAAAAHFANIEDVQGFWVPSNFNYEDSTVTTIEGITKGSPSWNCEKILKYCHCMIGKPKYVIIYKVYVTKWKETKS